MAGLMSALEKLEDETRKSEEPEDAFLRLVNEVVEVEVEVKTDEDTAEEQESVADDVEEATESLSSLAMTIKKFGICKPMMLAADPKASLVTAGLVRAYEELEDEPVKDADAEDAVEKISARLNQSKSGMIKLYKRMATNLRSIQASMAKRGKVMKQTLKAASSRMEEVEAIPEDTEATVVDYAKFEAAILAIRQSIKTMSDPEAGEYEEPEDAFLYATTTKLSKSGWSKDNIMKALKMAEEVEDELAEAEEPVAKMLATFEEDVDKVADVDEKTPEEEVTARMAKLQKSIGFKKMFRKTLRQARMLTSIPVRLVQKACRKNKK